MDISVVVIFVGLLVFLAHAFVALFERTKVPDVLFLILIGLVLGPVFKIVTPDDFGKVGSVFTVIVLVVILFEGGMQLSLESLLRTYKQTTKLTLVSYLVASVGITLLLHFAAGLSVLTAVFVGAVLAGPGPSVVMPLLKHVQISDSNRTVLTLESALGEALTVVVGLGVIRWAAMSSVQLGHMLGGLLSGFLFAAVIGAAGGYLWSVLLNKVHRLQNAMFTTPSFVFIIYGICELLGFSGPVSALAFGIVIGNIGDISIPF
ncbi:MAG TPA: cation:proton antiporter, partial [Candidatus Kryptobacter bacterium]|nr:cation:proton antiporter [Candidatus Kryptobacter bacterium]